MNIQKKDLGKSQIELTVELSAEEFKPYILCGAQKVSEEVKIEGFRPGKAPYEILKNKIGEMTILEAGARVAIDKTLDKVIKENAVDQIVGQPQVNITKLAPNNPMEYKVVLTMLPEVRLGSYKDLKIKQTKAEVWDEETEKLIVQLREMRASEIISEDEAKDGDRVIMDIGIFIDKVPIEGGQGKGVGLIIGQNYIIPGFDKKIIGSKKDDTKEFSLLYPTDYHDKNLAGKMAEFKITVKEVYSRILPEVSEEFAKSFGLKSLEELKSNIKKNLLAEKQQKEEQASEAAMLDKIISQSKFGDIPEALIKHEAEVMISELEYNVKNQGAKFEDYLTHLKKTRGQIMLDLMPNAVKRVKVSLIIRQVGNLEKISVSHEEIHKTIDDILKQYKGNETMIERIKGRAYHDYVENNLTGKKVVEKLKEWNVVK
ncbi:trigger factor [Patescibacteria group bacterium]|nr:trigger factor [Patescibacteria group bacterium]MBU1663300.1 trigger factor [Patescibacteria group bacterium]MBU1933907.1 trigger factor [Patescibacteria group bacterium]MBU2007566.1 trigger factor [Patescibacteria group bacterium]MBU2233541.1 trigger factor [Patescibacteria group bacterium]